ncbi:hypothetical protein F1847_09095 [Thermodesulfobacterium sp. TA1]|uniref:hypothetical protein n=1 Tax=Thermodesulfobacterium sp. TA1 TaxID=2234087 RepID=UPI001231AF00|nr:hypothetical protein [Thermodesulfobacterium sp. TA1]QER42884.1 hypothetical protein F1847_09095 [Thermodesulfobacterium sp. TA1]
MKQVVWVVLSFLVLVLFSGCGKKNPPLPPSKSVPKEFSFEVKPTEAGFELIIFLPTETKGGYPLVKISSLIIEKEEFPLDEGRPKIKTYEIKLSPKLHSAGNLYVYQDYQVKHRYGYRYRVKIKKDFLVKTTWVEFPNTLYWHNPPLFPENITCQVLTEDAVRLIWKKPENDIKGMPLDYPITYELERTSGQKVETFYVRKEEFLDRGSAIRKACYRVRSLLNFRGTQIPGPKSPPLCLDR